MIDYKLKLMNDEDDTLNFSTMRQNYKAYPREENNLGDDSSRFLLDYRNLCDTIIDDITYLSSNNIHEIIDSVLFPLHIVGEK